jgi:hypothetical protein
LVAFHSVNNISQYNLTHRADKANFSSKSAPTILTFLQSKQGVPEFIAMREWQWYIEQQELGIKMSVYGGHF